MLRVGPAKKLVVYVAASEKADGRAVHEALLQWLHDHGVAGATVTRAIGGYGIHGTLHAPHLFRLPEDLPVRVEVVESVEKMNHILPFVFDIVRHGLVEVLDTEVIKCSSREKPAERPTREHVRLEGRAKMLRVYVGENDRWEGEPLHEAIVKQLRMMDIAGATVYKGIMGYGANQRVHTGGFLGLSHDLPTMISVVDEPHKIRQAIAALDEMVGEGLMVLSDVEVIKYMYRQSAAEGS